MSNRRPLKTPEGGNTRTFHSNKAMDKTDLFILIYIGGSTHDEESKCLLQPWDRGNKMKIDFEARFWPTQEPRNKVHIDFEALRRATLNRLHPEVLMILYCPYHGPVPPYQQRTDTGLPTHAKANRRF
ncbi:hypothetical protein PG996_004691 [Apiospora saccharicola]|uniref:Uncharacterized protein n=1 Tax=Apiospora saccharicola TaxID=335842 RepID=A0ABR1W4V8_9PEZI